MGNSYEKATCRMRRFEVTTIGGASVVSISQLMMLFMFSWVNSAVFFFVGLAVFLVRNPRFPRVGCLLILVDNPHR